MAQSLSGKINTGIQVLGDLRDSAFSRWYAPLIPSGASLCKFLKSKNDVYHCTQFLRKNGFASHQCIAKNWDIANILADLTDGNLLDMGSWHSFILENALRKGLRGEKIGIDLQKPNEESDKIKYVVGDLLDTGFPDGFFQNITCLSVIEHEVDFNKFARETSRLLCGSGKLYVTFDYWTPKRNINAKLYGKTWNILDRNDVLALIEELHGKGLRLIQEVDWSLDKPVITWPDPKVSYTFGLLVFQKQ